MIYYIICLKVDYKIKLIGLVYVYKVLEFLNWGLF